MTKYYDIHTHRSCFQADNDCTYIVSVSPFEYKQLTEEDKICNASCFHSCGIHPWYLESSDAQMEYLSKIAGDSRIVAIGEAGLDKLRGASLDTQQSFFKKQIELSESQKKPLIIHCVQAWEELSRLRRETKPVQLWIIHGFRGKPELTKRLVKEGFLFSAGSKINKESMPLIPPDSIFCETDESEMNIREIYAQAAEAMGIEIDEFAVTVAKNVQRVFLMKSIERTFERID